MRGRIPAGPEVVEHLEGSTKAKERLRVILEVMMGKWRVSEACARLGISEQRFRQLRAALLQGALERLEDQPSGRPRGAEEDPELAALREQLSGLQDELRAAQVREEIALTLPAVVHEPAEAEKKTARRPKRRARPGWWKKQ